MYNVCQRGDLTDVVQRWTAAAASVQPSTTTPIQTSSSSDRGTSDRLLDHHTATSQQPHTGATADDASSTGSHASYVGALTSLPTSSLVINYVIADVIDTVTQSRK